MTDELARRSGFTGLKSIRLAKDVECGRSGWGTRGEKRGA